MVSDGKRMRILWHHGDGNGDSNKAFVMRSKTTVRGHPTWKMYMGKVPRPIIYGRREPPREQQRMRKQRESRLAQISLSGTMPAMLKPSPYVPGPIDGNIKPLSITDRAVQGSPYFDIPAAAMRKRPRPIPGDMAAVYAGFTTNRNAEAAGISAGPEAKKVKVKQGADIQNELLAITDKLDSSE
ncbi:uncharacterized protein J4E84_006430 [Alternaria hordeiaustralica]|uniref:uncharacterized protein n=1 Tax=Alternaria hordeiaustralica TaxID=1187925 RepID=UPI0020C5A8A3|nr:uncharacterized protein J4E84_006430 [Alternaria hordeiaustralica]KAI4684440.1 hypothetical protein J4E84_006430 [Alternaria hordeiaustralica]